MKVYSLIKEAIHQSDEALYKNLFNKKHQLKPFSFAVYLHDYQVSKDVIILKAITLTISTHDPGCFIALYNGLRRITSYKIGNGNLVKQNIRMVTERHITSPKVHFRTLSPLLVENKHGTPLHPHHEQFQQELNYYANLQVKQFLDRPLRRVITFIPIQMKKQVIKESNRHLNYDKKLFFTTYSGSFVLEGDPSDLQLLYQLGLGKRTVYYGLLEVVREEV